MWHKWRALSRGERRLIRYALLNLILVRLTLRWVSISRVYHYAQHGRARHPRKAESPDAIGQAVVRASNNRLVSFSCLPRALTLARMLRQNGYDAVLHIGVRKQAARLTAHAWVTLNGVPIGDSAEFVAQFQSFTDLEAGLEWV
ncbi:MAG: lasso peptide biosynthesis B2 protein [Anaerolineae bacterium]|nr:lasso peptide biosynthesis B2 protein [Anaerolineae bacterium]